MRTRPSVPPITYPDQEALLDHAEASLSGSVLVLLGETKNPNIRAL